MGSKTKTALGVLFIAGLCLGMFFRLTPTGVSMWNKYVHGIKTADDSTDYEKLKLVEETCRAMISTYKSDKLTYEAYKDSTSKDDTDFARQAKIRANKTAVTYNDYILKNSRLWKDNIPEDIKMELDVLE